MDSHMSKADLLALIRAEQANLHNAIDGLDEAALNAPGAEVDWSVKDIAAHLLFWQQRAIFYLQCAKTGWDPKADRWAGASVDKRNEENYKANHARPVGDVLNDLVTSEETLIEMLEATPEEQIFTPGFFDWLKASLLVEAIAGETYEHYQEHMESLRAWQSEHK